ncbi:MAG: phosphotransferase family protein [Gammaproteobacteria bacterium]|nr:phosphotransferase family protein [Gammaproteobacteria bacterium]
MSLDVQQLNRYLAAHIEDFSPIQHCTAFAEGQSNPTYLLRTFTGNYVLRKKPDGVLLKSAHAVDREFRVQQALASTDVPVAKMRHLCTDDSVLGTWFYVMDAVEGKIFWDPALPELQPKQRARVYDEMNRVLAAIHSVNLGEIGLEDYGKPGNYFARQLSRWTQQYGATDHAPIASMPPLIDWLNANLPPDDGQVSLVHGDYRIDNLMFDPDTLTIKAVFDWELSTLGHPLADLAYQIMQRSMGRDWHIKGLQGLDTAVLGIPDEQGYVSRYAERRGLSELRDLKFATVFSFFRFAAICHGVGARAAAGNAASPDAHAVGAMAEPLANIGLSLTAS